MLNIISSPTDEASPDFVQSKRKGKESNLAWLRRHLEPLKEAPKADRLTYMVLLGGRAKAHFRIRVAQSHLRHDFSPSHWSHALLLTRSTLAGEKRHRAWEINLEPGEGFGYPAADNAVQDGDVDSYDSAYGFPNVALLRLPVERAEVRRSLVQFKRQRADVDAVELLLLWLGYVWGVGRAGNPLLDGHGVPSAVLVESIVGASGYDLTPSLESRASCPEAFWQSARWWYPYYKSGDQKPPVGFWHMEHFLGK